METRTRNLSQIESLEWELHETWSVLSVCSLQYLRQHPEPTKHGVHIFSMNEGKNPMKKNDILWLIQCSSDLKALSHLSLIFK